MFVVSFDLNYHKSVRVAYNCYVKRLTGLSSAGSGINCIAIGTRKPLSLE